MLHCCVDRGALWNESEDEALREPAPGDTHRRDATNVEYRRTYILRTYGDAVRESPETTTFPERLDCRVAVICGW